MNIQDLTPTWPGRCVDMRLKQNKAILQVARRIAPAHVRLGAYATNSFTGVKTAWEFSNELLAHCRAEAATQPATPAEGGSV
jgi:hypothetical protein